MSAAFPDSEFVPGPEAARPSPPPRPTLPPSPPPSCKGRYFCPSCHAKRLARWTLWLDETLLAPVPHRQVVLTIPQRLRPYCLYRRARLGELAPLAAPPVPP